MSGGDLLGYLAALMVGVTFCCRTMVTLRGYAIVSNVLFIAYATKMGLSPILVLHVTLLPINILYLATAVRKLPHRGSAASKAGCAGIAAARNLVPPGTA